MLHHFMSMLKSSWTRSDEIVGAISLPSASILMKNNVIKTWFSLSLEIMISHNAFSWFLSWYVFLIVIQNIMNEIWIRRCCYWSIRHWILIRWTRIRTSRNIAWEIQISYFLMLVMMSRTQIHSCFNNIIIDMGINIMLPVSHHLSNQNVQGSFSEEYAMPHFEIFWFPAISIPGKMLRTLPCFAWMLQVLLISLD